MPDDVMKTTGEEIPVSTGVAREDRKRLAELLNKALSDTYMLYAKTHVYHWNVTGPLFYSVHKLTDDQYNDLAEAIDDIAERIRAIGFVAGGGLSHYAEASVVAEVTTVPSATDLVADLAKDHQNVAARMREVVEEAEKVDDVYTADLLTQRIGVHEEQAWMLNAIVAE